MSKRLTLDECQKFAKLKNGKCLSNEYKSNRVKMMWQCEVGHIWTATFGCIKNDNTWCPFCAKTVRLTLEDCILYAKNMNGKCLSTIYVNKEKTIWQCEFEHIWKANFNSMRRGKGRGSWCPYCSKTAKLTLFDCQNVAKVRGGLCLSLEYKHNKELMLWQCVKGHIWKAKFNCIKDDGQWCPECALHGPGKKLNLEDCILFAIKNGGKCLSTEYSNVDTKMLWQCADGHNWVAKFVDVKHKLSWCPHCSFHISKPQKKIYDYIVAQFVSLNIVLNDTKTIKPYDFDIYIPSLKLAIEYDGWRWHYSDWAISQGSLERIKKKDIICEEMGIKLLRINEKAWLSCTKDVLEQLNDIINNHLKIHQER